MEDLDRITFNPDVMGGKACIRGMRVTTGVIVGLVAAARDGTVAGGTGKSVGKRIH